MINITKDVDIVLRDVDLWYPFEIVDSETLDKIDLSQWQVRFYGLQDKLISDDIALLQKITVGEYQYHYNPTLFQGEYELLLTIISQVNNKNFFHNRLIKLVTPSILRNIIVLRNQLDKALKSVGKKIDSLQYFDNQEALDSYWKDFPYGYTDQHCVLYLELGLGMINITAPYTNFTLFDFPYAYAGNILIDAATLVALEAQGIFSIDTDFDYSLGGKSFTIRHFESISTFIRELYERFQKDLLVFKSAFRTKGTTLLQQPYGIVGFRLIQLAPTWLARFGIGVSKWI